MVIIGFHHVAISTSNLERLVAFYCDLFGFEKVFEFEWGVGVDAFDRMMAAKGTAARTVMLCESRLAPDSVCTRRFATRNEDRGALGAKAPGNGLSHVVPAAGTEHDGRLACQLLHGTSFPAGFRS